MEPDPIVIKAIKKRGRPKVEQRLSSVSTNIPPDVHDRLIQQAKREEITVSRLIRRLIIFRLK